MNEETKRRVAASAAGFTLPRYAQLPGMGLYLDQTVQYVNSHFRTFSGVELTGSMVSNYVKKGLITHPVRKKYTRDQIGYLMYIVVVKNVLSMENIQFLFSIQKERFDAGAAYNFFCDELEAAIGSVFGIAVLLLEMSFQDFRGTLAGYVHWRLTGEKVLGGEKIAVTGWGKGKSSKQSCTAEFQLWHMGQSLDPEKYITF